MTVEKAFTAEEYSRANENVDMNTKQFNNYLMELVAHVDSDMLKIFVGMAEKLWARVTESTPVLTGLAENNWQLDTKENNNIKEEWVLEAKKKIPYDELDRMLDEPESPTIPEDVKRTFILYLFNNLDYIVELEMGSSPQAGSGEMFSNNLAMFEPIFKEVAKEYGYI